MKTFLQNLLNLFKKKQPSPVPAVLFPLGARLNDEDTRDIPFSDAHPLTGLEPLEDSYRIDVSMLGELYQILGTCVAHTFVFDQMIKDYFETGKVIRYMVRFLYALARRLMGYENTDTAENQGLQPRQAAKIRTAVGIARSSDLDREDMSHSKYVNGFVTTQDMLDQARESMAAGFSFPKKDLNELRRAIKVAKGLPVTIGIDWAKLDKDGTVHAPVTLAGTHEVELIGWDKVNGGRFIAKNWWPGYEFLYIPFSEFAAVIFDAIAFTDMPNDLIVRAKLKPYYFATDLKIGMRGEAVAQLQKRLIAYGCLQRENTTTFFGPETLAAVMDYQAIKNLPATGYVGKFTREQLNRDVVAEQAKKSKLDLWCEAAIAMEGANPLNNNPFNLKAGQYTTQTGATGKNGAFATYPTYEKGYAAGRGLLQAAINGVSARYPNDLNLYEFYAGIPAPNKYGRDVGGYAPASDRNQPYHYAEVVAKHMGVLATTQIKNLA